MKRVIFASLMVLALAVAVAFTSGTTQVQAAKAKPTPTPTPMCQWLPVGCDPNTDPACEYSCVMP